MIAAATSALEWLGARARIALACSAVIALAVPALAEALRPALPALVAMVYALAMTRLDLGEILRGFLRPRRAALVLGLSLALLVVPATLCWLAVEAAGLGTVFEAAAVYTFAAPPIASAAGFAFIMGLEAALVLEVTVVSSFLMPLVGPALAHALLGADLPMSPGEMGLRVAAMIGAGAIAALIARRTLGAQRIGRRARAFDGLTAVAMTIFIIPLFDGVGETMLEKPALALAFLLIGFAMIFLPHLAAAALPGPRRRTGAIALTMGTRSVAIYLAALPPDPDFTMFVALYQVPMVLSPLLLRGLYERG
jgi:ACR3 family arsenite efflux pump ArsB